MVTKKTWKEFRESGLLWWVNMILHTFGWAIAIEIDDCGIITKVYPARVKFRGFDLKSNDDGYQKVSKYLEDTAPQLKKEAYEEE